MVVTEKLDGENTTLYADGTCHARSMDSGAHPSRTWMKQLAARIGPQLPPDTRICGENVYARHSLAYDQLDGWFYGLSVWTGDLVWAWDDTVAFLTGLGLPVPAVRWRGVFDRKQIRALPVRRAQEEGYVVRVTASFTREEFGSSLAKWVRPNHVTTEAHWMSAPVVPNGRGAAAVLWDLRSGLEPDARGLDAWWGEERPLLDLELPAVGETRLALALAGRFVGASRATLLPELMKRLPPTTARHVVDLVGLAPRLHRPMPDEARAGGLVSLGRAVDLQALHQLAGATASPEEANEVAWSLLVAEEAGLLDDPFHRRWCEEVVGDWELSAVRRARLVGAALWARASGTATHPGSARAVVHPLLTAPIPTLTVLVGPSGTGKSTLARTLRGERVSLDALRLAASERPLDEGLKRLEAALRGGGDVVWDATGITPSQRALPVEVGRRHGAMVRMVSMLTPRSLAEQQNRARSRTVPADVTERQWRRLRWPYAFEADELVDYCPQTSRQFWL